jgi:tetratricopeptide (TPR) repeat protein
MYNFQIRTWVSNYRFTQKLVAARVDLMKVSDEQLDSIVFESGRAPSLGKAELRYQYVLLVSDLITQGSSLDQLSLRKHISLAETVLAKNITKRPHDADLHLEMANFYLLAGRVDPIYWQRGLELAQKIRQDNPQRTQLLYLVGQFHLALGQKTEGLALFHQAALLRPDVPDTHIQYYKQLSNNGELKLAQEYFDQHLQDSLSHDLLKLVQFDLGSHHLDLAARHLEILKQTKKLPQDAAILSSLLLLAQGKEAEAISSAQEVVKQFPLAYPVLSQYFITLQP